MKAYSLGTVTSRGFLGHRSSGERAEPELGLARDQSARDPIAMTSPQHAKNTGRSARRHALANPLNR
jgi:hypothetical protein